jgi:hypothetical protein
MIEYNAILDVKFTLESTTEPCTLAEAKEWCKIELPITEDDALITELIKTSRLQCEGFVNISFVNRTVTALINNSQGDCALPYGPVDVITTVKDGSGTIITSTGYNILGSVFKFVNKPVLPCIEVVYTSGYSTLPVNFKTAVLQQVAYLYENRGDEPANATTQNNKTVPTELSPLVKLILNPYRRVW